MNLYIYVGNNPLNLTDPMGLTWKSNWNFFWDWVLGRENRNRSYGPDDIETQEMMRSVAAQKMREEFKTSGKSSITFTYKTAEAALDTLLNPFTADWSSTSAQVGGFGDATIVDNGDGTVTVTIKNVAGTHSFFYHVVQNVPWGKGPLSNITQTFQWTESIRETAPRPGTTKRSAGNTIK